MSEVKQMMKRFALLLLVVTMGCGLGAMTANGADLQTVTVSAEGLADPAAEKYRGDRELMVDELRNDARRQVVEKAVGVFVDSASLVENYTLISDRVLTQSSGMIKRIIKESKPWQDEDGLMHLLLKAEVYLGQVKDSLKEMSRDQRQIMIKESGNPRIAVEILARDAARGQSQTTERSQVAENILKEHFSGFGYRVWSLRGDDRKMPGTDEADFLVQGEAKFKKLSATLKASGITVTKYALTAWTVKCLDLHTKEEILFTNRVPQKRSWSSEDAALEDIGRMVAEEFNVGFFETHLLKPSRIYQMRVDGLPDYDTGLQLKREMIGLRHILNVDFRSFTENGGSLFEIDFAGHSGNFMELVNNAVIHPLNRKMGRKMFKLVEISGETMRIRFDDEQATEVKKIMTEAVPAALAESPPQRLADIVQSPELMKKVAQVNPEGVQTLAAQGNPLAQQAVESF